MNQTTRYKVFVEVLFFLFLGIKNIEANSCINNIPAFPDHSIFSTEVNSSNNNDPSQRDYILICETFQGKMNQRQAIENSHRKVNQKIINLLAKIINIEFKIITQFEKLILGDYYLLQASLWDQEIIQDSLSLDRIDLFSSVDYHNQCTAHGKVGNAEDFDGGLADWKCVAQAKILRTSSQSGDNNKGLYQIFLAELQRIIKNAIHKKTEITLNDVKKTADYDYILRVYFLDLFYQILLSFDPKSNFEYNIRNKITEIKNTLAVLQIHIEQFDEKKHVSNSLDFTDKQNWNLISWEHAKTEFLHATINLNASSNLKKAPLIIQIFNFDNPATPFKTFTALRPIRGNNTQELIWRLPLKDLKPGKYQLNFNLGLNYFIELLSSWLQNTAPSGLKLSVNPEPSILDLLSDLKSFLNAQDLNTQLPNKDYFLEITGKNKIGVAVWFPYRQEAKTICCPKKLTSDSNASTAKNKPCSEDCLKNVIAQCSNTLNKEYLQNESQTIESVDKANIESEYYQYGRNHGLSKLLILKIEADKILDKYSARGRIFLELFDVEGEKKMSREAYSFKADPNLEQAKINEWLKDWISNNPK